MPRKPDVKKKMERLCDKLEFEGFANVQVSVEKECYDDPPEEGGWRECYAIAIISPDTVLPDHFDRSGWQNDLRNWIAEQFPVDYAVVCHALCDEFEVYDPERME